MTVDMEKVAIEILYELKQLRQEIKEMAAAVNALGAEKQYATRTPLLLREAADVCHVELVWLREKVSRKEIPAYRPGAGSPWRVFPKDITALVMSTNNVERHRRKSVLRG